MCRIKLAALICGQLIINDNYIGEYSPMIFEMGEQEMLWAKHSRIENFIIQNK